MANEAIATSVRKSLRAVTIPGGGNLADYGGLSEIIVTQGAVAFAISE